MKGKDLRINPLNLGENPPYCHWRRGKSCKLQASERTFEKRARCENPTVLGKLPGIPRGFYFQSFVPTPSQFAHYGSSPAVIYISILASVEPGVEKLSRKIRQVLPKRHFRQVGFGSPPISWEQKKESGWGLDQRWLVPIPGFPSWVILLNLNSGSRLLKSVGSLNGLPLSSRFLSQQNLALRVREGRAQLLKQSQECWCCRKVGEIWSLPQVWLCQIACHLWNS